MTTAQTAALSPTATAVLDYLAQNGPSTVRDIARHFRIPFPTALGALLSLCGRDLACTEVKSLRPRALEDARNSPLWRAT